MGLTYLSDEQLEQRLAAAERWFHETGSYAELAELAQEFSVRNTKCKQEEQHAYT